MKKVLTIAALFSLTLMIYSFTSPVTTTDAPVKWYTWEEAVAANEKNPKKFYIDIYTDWCGWCKVMDKKTFTDPKVAAYLNEHYYPIKLNAEQKEEINFKGTKFVWKDAGRRGVHTLAYSLLEGKMSFPSFVYLTPNYERIMVSPGYKEAKDLLPELKFAQEEHYKTTTFEKYKLKAAAGK